MLLLITQTSAFKEGEVGNRRSETVITLESQLLNDFIKKLLMFPFTLKCDRAEKEQICVITG